jgi:hypothetical protein
MTTYEEEVMAVVEDYLLSQKNKNATVADLLSEIKEAVKRKKEAAEREITEREAKIRACFGKYYRIVYQASAVSYIYIPKDAELMSGGRIKVEKEVKVTSQDVRYMESIIIMGSWLLNEGCMKSEELTECEYQKLRSRLYRIVRDFGKK